jgi:hypothetical protein
MTHTWSSTIRVAGCSGSPPARCPPAALRGRSPVTMASPAAGRLDARRTGGW